MNRTDRLVSMVMLLQSRRVVTAAQLAEHFEITERTVYRDLAALGEGGVPVVGEAGVGYSLVRGYHLPPVMFSPDEAFALVTGGLFAERMTDASMREAIRSALGKVTAVLPSGLQGRVDRLRKTMVVGGRSPSKGAIPLCTVQQAMAEGRVLRLRYRGAAREESTDRVVEPLGLVFYLEHWHLIAWCRLRKDVRDFRVDRIIECVTSAESVQPRPDFNLSKHLAQCMVPDHGQTAIIEVADKQMEIVRRHWGPAVLEERASAKQVRVRLAFGKRDLDFCARWLLGMGTEVRIVEPAVLRARVIALAQAAALHHQAEKV